MMRQEGEGGGGGGGGGGTTRCEDCGNQAKKECVYMRCRTCCKSKGFKCQTHIKSTWVPAYRRKPRTTSANRNLSALAAAIHLQQLQVPNPNRVRVTDINYPSSSSPGVEEGNFPAEVSSTATFRCFRVSSMDEAVDQLAYQAVVGIGGHVFKGILYDQGPADGSLYPGENSPCRIQDPANREDNHRGGGSGLFGANLGITAPAFPSTSTAIASQLDPSSYPFPLNAFMSGRQDTTGP